MTKKQIDKLALQSYRGNNLDSRRVEEVVAGISRLDLKMYIRALKNWESRESINIIIPNEKYKNNLKVSMLKKMFPSKKIKFILDSSLVAGVRIINQDMVYDFNLKNTLEDIVGHIRKQYD